MNAAKGSGNGAGNGSGNGAGAGNGAKGGASGKGGAGGKAKAAPPCTICGKPQARTYRPFCSKRCADVDLGRWLGGRYAIAGEPVESSDLQAEAPDSNEADDGASDETNDG